MDSYLNLFIYKYLIYEKYGILNLQGYDFLINDVGNVIYKVYLKRKKEK